MNRAAFCGIAMAILGVSAAMFAPAGDEWRIAGLAVLVGMVTILVVLLAYRILYQGRGEKIVAETLGDNADGGDH